MLRVSLMLIEFSISGSTGTRNTVTFFVSVFFQLLNFFGHSRAKYHWREICANDGAHLASHSSVESRFIRPALNVNLNVNLPASLVLTRRPRAFADVVSDALLVSRDSQNQITKKAMSTGFSGFCHERPLHIHLRS